MLKEIMNAINVFGKQIQEDIRGLEKKFNSLETRMDSLENKVDDMKRDMDKGFERLDAKYTGMRVEFSESQETINYLASKSLQHEQRLRNIHNQQL